MAGKGGAGVPARRIGSDLCRWAFPIPTGRDACRHAELAPFLLERHVARFRSMSDIPQDISHDQHAVRRQKLADMRAAGFDPFRANVAPTHFSADAKALYVEGQDYAVTVTVAGRLVTFRVQGGSSFVKIQDQQGQVQLYFRKDVLGEERYGVFKKSLDLGDIIGVTGALFKTKTGEITVQIGRASCRERV